MKAIDVHCSVCPAAPGEPCTGLFYVPEVGMPRVHQSRILRAAKATRDENLARKTGAR